MAKHTDSSRSTDSGVSGNAQTGARGSRESAHKFARQLIGTDDCVWKIQVHTSDGFKYLDESELAELIEAYALSECSRLASRVEELEKLVKVGFDGLDAIMSAPEPIGWYVSKGTMDKVEAAWRKLQNVAVAHAEEKE